MSKPALILVKGDPAEWTNPSVNFTLVGINASGQVVTKQSDGTITILGAGGGGGNNGWTPTMAIVADGERRVMQITGWTGGSGTPPASGVYVGPTGFVNNIANATDIRGAAGGGGGSGTVTSVNGTTANGFTASTTNPTTTPVVSVGTTVTGILYGNGTGVAAANAGNFPVLNQSTTGNAATATALQTSRNINGQAFNGTADITVTAAAGTLTGGTLAAGVTSAPGLLSAAGGAFGTAAFVAASTFEPALGNPGTNGYVLASTTGGVRSWVPNGGGGGGSGTVTDVSVVSANGLAGSVATSTTTPAITLSTTVTGIAKGNGTAFSAATAGTDYSAGTGALATGILKSTTTTGALSIAVAGDFPTLNQNTTGSAATLTTPRNINGVAFNGSANVTVPAASNTLTGTTLASNVVASSLTSAAGGAFGTGAYAAAAAGANPTATVSGTATNGVATTFMRSDAAPALATTGVSAGAYTSANITVDAYGRVTAAANGSGGGGNPLAINDSFRGTLLCGINANGTGTAVNISATAAPDSSSGLLTINTGTTAAGRALYGGVGGNVSGAYMQSVLDGTATRFKTRVSLAQLSNGTDRYVFTAGLSIASAAPAVATDGLRIDYSDNVNGGVFTFRARSGGTETTLNGPSVAAATYYDIEILASSSTAEAWINGSSLGTITTNIPTAAGAFLISMVNSLGTGAGRIAYARYYTLGT